MINVQLAKWERGYALTEGARFRAPWDDSPEYLGAVEQASPIVVTRVSPLVVGLEWGPWVPEDGHSATCDIWIDVTVDVGQPVHHYVIDWGDFSSDVKPGYGLKQIHFQARKEHIAGEAAVYVHAYTAENVLIESGMLWPAEWHLEYRWRVHQYRIERFKGRINYAEQGKRWLQDWAPIPESLYSTYLEIEATERWNWGFRLWLRELDGQGRPGLTMIPSAWVSTGTGEGSISLSGWGHEWGSEWGSS